MHESKAKKLRLTAAITLLLFAAGCTNNMSEKDRATQTESNTQYEETAEENADTIGSGLDGLVLNEYPDLELTAAVLERKAILSGTVFPVNIIIKNNGDKSIAYVRGSGSYEIPEALIVDTKGLQPILPVSHLGIATMDFRTDYLEPGEQIEYIYYIMAVETNNNFNQYTHDLYAEDQTYIGDLSWDKLQDKFPDLMAASPASYDIDVYFRYHIMDNENENIFSEATGYTESKFSINITE